MQAPDSDDDWDAPTPLKMTSVLFDLKTEIAINAPADMMPPHDDFISEVALATVISHALFEHESWWNFRWALFYEARQTLIDYPPAMWNSEEVGRRQCKFTIEISGMYTNVPMGMEGFTTVHETTRYDGCVEDSQILLDYETSLHLSLAILNGDDHSFFERHNFDSISFPQTSKFLANNLCNIFDVHKQRNLKIFHHNVAWSKASENLLGD